MGEPTSQPNYFYRSTDAQTGVQPHIDSCTFRDISFDGDELATPFQPSIPFAGDYVECRLKCMEQQTAGNACQFWRFLEGLNFKTCVLFTTKSRQTSCMNGLSSLCADGNYISGDDTCWPR